MTNQEIFTTVKNHLLTQNARSAEPIKEGMSESYCKYRGPNGLMCAVGCLIPDEMYSDSIEFNPVGYLPKEILDHMGGNEWLLQRLQSIHDLIEVENWHSALGDLATEFNLSME